MQHPAHTNPHKRQGFVVSNPSTLLQQPRQHTDCPLSCNRSRLKMSEANSVKSSECSPLRVGIAGGGIAGLATALTLLKTANNKRPMITIFDSRYPGETRSAGAALNMSGGAAVLANYYDLSLSSIGYPLQRVVAKACSGASEHIFNADITALLNSSAQFRNQLMNAEGEPQLFAVMRGELLDILRERIEPNVKFVFGKHSGLVVGVSTECERGKGRLHLADGSVSEEFDLIVGADGLRSSVRNFISGEMRPPLYTGFRVQWAVKPSNKASLPRGELRQWFGNGGYVLHYAGGNESRRQEVIALTFQEPERSDENVNYYQSPDDRKGIILQRLENCGMPEEVLSIVENAERTIETAVYEHEVLSDWSKDGCCVLVGDAAHAMAPFLGQGANQAIQDAHTLAVAISEIGTKHPNMSTALKKYEAIRKPPTTKIMQSSRLLGKLETQSGYIGTTVRDNLFRIAGILRLPQRIFLTAALPRME